MWQRWPGWFVVVPITHAEVERIKTPEPILKFYDVLWKVVALHFAIVTRFE